MTPKAATFGHFTYAIPGCMAISYRRQAFVPQLRNLHGTPAFSLAQDASDFHCRSGTGPGKGVHHLGAAAAAREGSAW